MDFSHDISGYLFSCLRRCVTRTDHPTLNESELNTVPVVLSFWKQFAGFRDIGARELGFSDRDKELQIVKLNTVETKQDIPGASSLKPAK